MVKTCICLRSVMVPSLNMRCLQLQPRFPILSLPELELRVSACPTSVQVLSRGHSGRDAVAAGEVSGAAQRAAVTAQPSSNAASAQASWSCCTEPAAERE